MGVLGTLAANNAFSRTIIPTYRPTLSLPVSDPLTSPNWFLKTPTASAAWGLSEGVTLAPAAGSGNVARLDLITGDIVGDFDASFTIIQQNTTAADSGFVMGVGDGVGAGLLPNNAVGIRVTGSASGVDRNANGTYTNTGVGSSNYTSPAVRQVQVRRIGTTWSIRHANATATDGSWGTPQTYTGTGALATLYLGAFNGAATNVSYQIYNMLIQKPLATMSPAIAANTPPDATQWQAPKGSGTALSGSFGLRVTPASGPSSPEWVESINTFTDDIEVVISYYATVAGAQRIYMGLGSGADSTEGPTTAVQANMNYAATASASTLSVSSTTTGSAGLALVGSAVTKTLTGGSNFAMVRMRYTRATGLMQIRYWFYGTQEPTAWDVSVTAPVLSGGLYFYWGVRNGTANATQMVTAFNYIAVNDNTVSRLIQSWDGGSGAFDQAIITATTSAGPGQTPVVSTAKNAPAQAYHSKAWAHSGPMSSQWSVAASTALYAVMPFATPLNSTAFLREYVMLPPASTNIAKRMYEFRDPSNVLLSSLSIGSTNLISLTNASGTVMWTSTNPCPHTGVTVRFEMQLNIGAGTAQILMFLGDSLTPFEDSGPLTANFGSTAITTVRLGSSGTATAAFIWYRDDLAFDSSTVGLGWIGPKLAVPALESFGGADGLSLATGRWEQTIGGLGTAALSSNAALFTPTNQPGTGYGVNSWHYTGMPFAGDTDVTATITLSNITTEQYQGIGINLDPLSASAGQSANSWHIEANTANNTVELYYGSFTQMASAPKTYTAGAWRMRLQRIANIVRVKMWQGTEPATWDITYDANSGSRALGIGLVSVFNQNGGAGNSMPITIDDLSIAA